MSVATLAAQLLRARASAEESDRMPLNTESPSTESCQEFCLALKAARERKRITLAEMARATKIPASLFASLERGDLRRWPKGLFRRSFFREYVRMIGLPAAETCDEFVRLFPDHEVAQCTRAAAAPNGTVPEEDDVRLVLDAAWQGPRPSMLSRLFAATLDLGAVALMSTALSRAAGIDGSATTAIIALTYFSLATVLFGETPAKWVIARRRVVVD